MEVKIDADELCELRKKAKETVWMMTPGDYAKYNKAIEMCIDLQGAVEDLKKERDWWRDQAFYRGDNLSCIKNVTDRLEYGELADMANKLGYDLGR